MEMTGITGGHGHGLGPIPGRDQGQDLEHRRDRGPTLVRDQDLDHQDVGQGQYQGQEVGRGPEAATIPGPRMTVTIQDPIRDRDLSPGDITTPALGQEAGRTIPDRGRGRDRDQDREVLRRTHRAAGFGLGAVEVIERETITKK